MSVLKIKKNGEWVKVGVGAQGTPGSNGVSIVSIERTSGNGAAGTTDTYTISMSDGTASTFTVYNGADGTMTFEDLTEEQKASLKGDKGAPFTYEDFTEEQLAQLKGAPGDTPVRGEDYWTEADKTEIVNSVLANFTDVSEVGM